MRTFLKVIPQKNQVGKLQLSEKRVFDCSSKCSGASQRERRDSDAPVTASPTPAIATTAAPAFPLSGVAALFAVARLHKTLADATTLGHQMGLSTGDKLRSADLMRAVKRLESNTNVSRRSVPSAWH